MRVQLLFQIRVLNMCCLSKFKKKYIYCLHRETISTSIPKIAVGLYHKSIKKQKILNSDHMIIMQSCVIERMIIKSMQQLTH